MKTDVQGLEMFVGGRWEPAADGSTYESVDPYRAEGWAEVPEAGAEDVRRAIGAARRAFDQGPWPRLSGRDRARILRRLAMLIEREAATLVDAEVRDNGKVIREVAGQISSLPEYYEYFAGMADKLEG